MVSSVIKRCCLFFEQGVWWLLLPLAGHGGEGWERSCCSSFASERRPLLHHRAPHAVDKLAVAILGQKGGRSSTSISEACSIRRRSSAARYSQVVHPRLQRGCRRLWSLAGRETPSGSPCSDLGVLRAWRSPATGGGDDPGPDCFPLFSSRVWNVKEIGRAHV